MSTLIDQTERDRFVQEQEKNISVIAPAGVGKTTSIVDRIVHLAQLPEAQAVDRLSRLIVVTYSVRAAQQMQQKARTAIRSAQVSIRVQRAFQQTFFGTIHSYCVRLLERFGHYLGLPSPVGLLQDQTELWNRFLLRGLGQGMASDENVRELFHFYSPEKLYALGKEISPGEEIKIGSLPHLHFERLLNYDDALLHPSTKRSIVHAQKAAEEWSKAWGRGEHFRPIPKCPTSIKAADFAQIWHETFLPLYDWLREAALAFGRRIANAYENFRLAEAVMTYDDQVRLALRVLEHPAVRRELASDRLSVLLDEAQDTDPRQFEVLRRIAGLDSETGQGTDQTFSIVGDFQQAIYAPRSDLGAYRKIHDEISSEPRGTSSRLRVTFRCDTAIIKFVNQIFPSVLINTAGQCSFETLVPRDQAGEGQVVRWLCPDEIELAADEKIDAETLARHEARFVAEKIKALGPEGLGARDWSQVAIICPRKNWLFQVQRELMAQGLPVQLHSSNEQQRDSTATAWLTALIWITAHPEDTFEIAGVLREILGVSDSDIARLTRGEGDKLRLDRSLLLDDGAVGKALSLLREACALADVKPMVLAVNHLLDVMQLRQRLHSIPDLEPEDVDRELDDFLAIIYSRAADGATLAELAQELRPRLNQVHPAEEEIRDAIQLLTSHKAKGLEWQTVIVPFVFRAIESSKPIYPRLVIGEGGHEMICRDKADFARHARNFAEARERQQLQRLMYVMSTRAKRSLIFIDDDTLYAQLKRRSGWSAAELLDLVDGQNRAIWKALPETTLLLPENTETKPVSKPSLPPLPDLSSKEFSQAIERAGVFPHRVTPHRLALHVRDESEPEKQIEVEEDAFTESVNNPSLRYGTWWHELMETIPWQQPVEDWQQKFLAAQKTSPMPNRSAMEWDLFRQSTLAGWLAQPGRLIQVEIPFLWRESEMRCLEGVIDLAVFTESEPAWQIIDWKTNRVGPDGSAGLVEIYREQIRAYVKALRQMLSAEVNGSLYLTANGEWLSVD